MNLLRQIHQSPSVLLKGVKRKILEFTTVQVGQVRHFGNLYTGIATGTNSAVQTSK